MWKFEKSFISEIYGHFLPNTWYHLLLVTVKSISKGILYYIT